ncbi:MAG: protoporphyrinogen oxidase [Bacteroidetes bacterium]|nr:protoporphyrinogen oxidase [Bacteroidota bacterium]
MARPHTVIIGGGISGLTVAYWLQRGGAEVTVLERESVPGGTMRTVSDGGWLVETGPNSALETSPVFKEMFEGIGITPDRLYADAASNKRYILRNGQLHPLPMSPPAFFKSRLWSVPGKLRLLQEPFIGRATKEETVAEFVERRLGREFLDYAINPFVAGVFAGNPEELSVRHAFPKLYALEEKYGGLIKGMIGGARERRRRAEVAKDRAQMFSFSAGMKVFPDALGRFLGQAVEYDCDVRGIKVGQNGTGGGSRFTVEYSRRGTTAVIEAERVVLAVPAYVASSLLDAHAPGLAAQLREVYYPPVAEVFLGYRIDQSAHPLDGFGFLIPAVERRQILGTIWSSALFPRRAPAGHIALTTFVGGSRQPDLASLPDAELLRSVRSELGALMGVHGEPAYARINRWEKAIPQYNLGYQRLLDAIDGLEMKFPGLVICSNFRGGIAVGDCVKNGKATAQKLIEQARAGA